MVESLWRLIDERYVSFNDTLYQLEPNIKDAPGALRDLTACAPSSRFTDPRCSIAARPIARASMTLRSSCCGFDSILHLEGRRNQNALSHELQDRGGAAARLSDGDAAAAGRAVDGRLLPPRAQRRAGASRGRGRRR